MPNLPHVELDHQEQRDVVERRRDRRHQDDVEIADLQEFGDQERGGTEHRRRDDRAETPGCEQSARRLRAVTGAREHRPGNGADRHRRGHTRSRRAAEQERRQHDGTSRARVLATHRGEAEVEEELAGTRLLQERAVDREQDDQRRRHVDRRAENAFERLVHEPGEARHVVAAMRPLPREPRARESVGDEARYDDRDDPSRRAPARLEHEQHEHDAERDVGVRRCRVTVPEIVAALQQVDDGRGAGNGARRRPTTSAGCDNGPRSGTAGRRGRARSRREPAATPAQARSRAPRTGGTRSSRRALPS